MDADSQETLPKKDISTFELLKSLHENAKSHNNWKEIQCGHINHLERENSLTAFPSKSTTYNLRHGIQIQSDR